MRFSLLNTVITMITLSLVLTLAGCSKSSTDDSDTAKNGTDTAKATTPDDTATTQGEPPQIFVSPDPKDSPDRNRTVLAADTFMDDIEIAPARVLDGKITIQLPIRMKQMTDQQLDLKYPGASRPDLAFTDSSTRVNLTMTHTSQPLQRGQIYEYHQLFEGALKASASYKYADWLSNEQVTVDGRPCFLLQFRNQLTDQEVYNMILGTSLDESLLLITFNFPRGLEDTWMVTAKSILLTAEFHDESDRQPATTQPAGP